MESATFELSESLKKDRDESVDIFRGIESIGDLFTIVSVGVTNSDPVYHLVSDVSISLRAHGWSRKKMFASLFQP